MNDQQPHAPSYEEVREAVESDVIFLELGEFDRFLAARDARIEAAAEQRGAEQAFRKAQEIIAGFEHTIDEARNRDDMINTGYLIQEIDTEIQDLMEG